MHCLCFRGVCNTTASDLLSVLFLHGSNIIFIPLFLPHVNNVKTAVKLVIFNPGRNFAIMLLRLSIARHIYFLHISVEYNVYA